MRTIIDLIETFAVLRLYINVLCWHHQVSNYVHFLSIVICIQSISTVYRYINVNLYNYHCNTANQCTSNVFVYFCSGVYKDQLFMYSVEMLDPKKYYFLFATLIVVNMCGCMYYNFVESSDLIQQSAYIQRFPFKPFLV